MKMMSYVAKEGKMHFVIIRVSTEILPVKDIKNVKYL